MSEFWNNRILDIETYTPGEQLNDRKYIKLNTNENPYPPSQKVLRAIKKSTNKTLRLYPDPNCNDLKNVISEYCKVSKEQIFVGNGSDEVLAFTFGSFFNSGKPILFPDVTYSFYPVYANFFGLNYKTVPLNEDFSIPVDKFLQENNGVIIPNPNSPTSKYLSIQEIIKIIEYNLSIKKIVVIDEAYIDFGGESIISLIDKYSNLLVIQTLSKSRSLAGLRIGLAFGQKDLIEGLNKVKGSINSYTVDRLASAGAIAAFKDEDYFNITRNKVIHTRKWVCEELQKIGFMIITSATNFIFISHTNVFAEELYSKLKENGILVRYFNKPRIDNFIRVSIGTNKEMKEFISRISKIVE